MAKKKSKASKITAKRQVFLDALQIIKKHQRDNETCFLKAAEELSKLLGNAPRSGWLAEEWAICSALWVSEMPGFHQDLDQIHEQCKGGELFLVAYRLGVISALKKQRREK